MPALRLEVAELRDKLNKLSEDLEALRHAFYQSPERAGREQGRCLETDDFPQHFAEELDPALDVPVGGGVDGEAVYPVDLPAGKDLSHLIGVAEDYLGTGSAQLGLAQRRYVGPPCEAR